VWNKGKLTAPKPPLRLGHVWSIRARLQLERRTRELALFNLAMDSKLRGCDLVAVRVDDERVGDVPEAARATEIVHHFVSDTTSRGTMSSID